MAAHASKFAGWLGARTLLSQLDWEAVYAEQLPRVYNFLRYRVGDDVLAEDLTSTTFEKAWRKRSQYNADVAGFSTWLFSIARNAAADHFRSQRQSIPLDSFEHTLRAPDENSPDWHAERRDESDLLLRALRSLSENERDVLALKHGAGLNNRAISVITGLSESNVGTIAQRGLTRLRALWRTTEEP
jgi:RNA polymerase sigma-70 factor (ECF subfamily)